jgi:hypothetical protein
MIPHFGALTGTALTATLNPPLPELTRKIQVDQQHVRWSDLGTQAACETDGIEQRVLHAHSDRIRNVLAAGVGGKCG